MATKLRRQADIIKTVTSNYEASINAYGATIDRSNPVFITYYKIYSEASRQDFNLDNVGKPIGLGSGTKYIKIKNVPVYKLSIPEVNRNLTDRGYEAQISGDFIISPNIRLAPVADEFFVIEQDGFEEHIFRIIDVQYDKMTSNKFYKPSYILYNENAQIIEENVIKTLVMLDNGDGTFSTVTETEAARQESISNMIDTLIDEYINLFYDADLDHFVYKSKELNSLGNSVNYWCPYINHFIHKNKVLEKYNTQFLTEIYVKDYNEHIYGYVYSEESYRNSIYFAVEIDDYSILNFKSSFACLSPKDIKMPLTLPFYSSLESYKMIDFYNEDYGESFFLNSFHIILENEKLILSNVEDQYKFVDFNEYENTEKEEELKPFRCLYQYNNKNKVKPINVYYISNDIFNDTYDVIDANILSLIEDTSLDDNKNYYLFNLIKQYFNKTFIASDELLKTLNIYYYKKTLNNYLLMPIIIYILREQIKKR